MYWLGFATVAVPLIIWLFYRYKLEEEELKRIERDIKKMSEANLEAIKKQYSESSDRDVIMDIIRKNRPKA